MKRAGVLLALLACAADPRSPDPRDPGGPSGQAGPSDQAGTSGQAGPSGTNMHTVTLTAGARRQDLVIPPLSAVPTTLILPITAIANPSAQAFSLSASVVWSNAGAAVPGAPEVAGSLEESIGVVTPFPPAEPGSFALGVPGAARSLLSRREGQLTLRLSLQPIAADRVLAEPLQVTLGEPTWR